MESFYHVNVTDEPHPITRQSDGLSCRHSGCAVLTDDTLGLILSQTLYTKGARSHTTLSPPLLFGGVSLLDALREDLHDLRDPKSAAFPMELPLGQKMSVRILVNGVEKYDRQVTILHAKNRPPTRAELAVVIAKEVQRFLDREKQNCRPLKYCARDLTMNDLTLQKILHVSRSSIQPVIGVMPLIS
ncbi:hypothetical protein C8Q74DRAFT_957259 [Fomes fomentarius]|nr:hypothetical protein C8Q74DRAFT_957259 [Fomes fomentarius]